VSIRVLHEVIITGFPWFAPVRTGVVRTGSNQKCDQFPWFDPIPGRNCLLPIKYTFSAEYCLPFCRLRLYVFKMSPKRLRMFLILFNKPRNFIIWKVTRHICSKIRWLRSTRMKYSTSFYLHNQKTALNGVNQAFLWCAPPLSANHWVRTAT